MSAYPVPAAHYRLETEVRRSRFITSVARANTVDTALAFIEQIRNEFADASHHCYAYRVGPPGDTSRIGMSDAGEPRGTAGRPMLSVLVHADIGDLAVVVTRYFGGTKLGTGGLVRAYSSAVQQALQSLPLILFQAMAEYTLEVDYAHYESLSRWLTQHDGTVLESDFAARVSLKVQLPEEHQDSFINTLERQGIDPQRSEHS